MNSKGLSILVLLFISMGIWTTKIYAQGQSAAFVGIVNLSTSVDVSTEKNALETYLLEGLHSIDGLSLVEDESVNDFITDFTMTGANNALSDSRLKIIENLLSSPQIILLTMTLEENELELYVRLMNLSEDKLAASARFRGNAAHLYSLANDTLVFIAENLPLLFENPSLSFTVSDRFAQIMERYGDKHFYAALSFKRGFEFYRQKDYHNAIPHFLDAINKDPDFKMAYYYMGLTYQKLLEYVEGVKATGETGIALQNELPQENNDNADRYMENPNRLFLYSIENYMDSALYWYESYLETVLAEASDKSAFNLAIQMGELYLESGDYLRAEAAFENAVNAVGEDFSVESQVKALSFYAESKRLNLDISAAIDILEQALEIANSNKYLQIMILNNKGVMLYELERFEDAREILEDALELGREINDQSYEGLILKHLGMVFYHLENWERARQYYRRAIDIFNQQEDWYRLVRTYYYMSVLYENIGEKEAAEEYMQESMRLSTDLGIFPYMWRSHYYLGLLEEQQIFVSEAYEEYVESITERNRYQEIMEYLIAYHFFSYAHLVMGNTEELANSIDQLSFITENELSSPSFKALEYSRLGKYYYLLSDYDNSFIYYAYALEAAESLNAKAVIAQKYYELGIIFYYRGIPETAIDSLLEAAIRWEELGHKYNLIAVYQNIGQIYLNTGQTEYAAIFFEEIDKLKEEIGLGISQE